MKRFLFILLFSLFATSCTNAQKTFCTEASTKMCTICEQCGSFPSCGLPRVSNRAECIEILENVCSAYDGVYSRELARTCMSSLDDLSCDQLKNSGRPDVCTRLF